MRRFAVISDVHANLEALDAVLHQVEGMEVYCLGDLVDYGADPNEVITALKERGVMSMMGNHDVAALNGDTSLFNARASMSSIWTAGRLTEESIGYLRGLPQDLRVRIDGVETYFAHGSPDDRLWEYVDPRTHSDLLGHYLAKLKVKLVGLGHTHTPYVWIGEQGTVFNPGSVGQPRDGDWRASYAVLAAEGDKVEVEVRRVEYDVEKAASKVRAAGLPDFYATRLLTGS